MKMVVWIVLIGCSKCGEVGLVHVGWYFKIVLIVLLVGSKYENDGPVDGVSWWFEILKWWFGSC